MPEGPAALMWRRLAAFLLLWAMLPLPFLYIILPPFWLLAMLVGFWRILEPEHRWAPSTAVLNLLALIIIFLVLSAGGLRIGPLRPLGHLLILLTTLKVAQVDGRRDFRRLLAPLFLVQLIGIVSAVHVSVLFYLAVSVVWWWFVGIRVLLGEVSDELRDHGLGGFREDAKSCPEWKHTISAAALAILLALPVFLLFPRLSSPFLALEGQGREAGFSTRVELDHSTSILESPDPVMRLQAVDGRPVRESWLRLRATAYDEVFSGIWKAPGRGLVRAKRTGGLISLLSDGDLSGSIELKMTPLRPEDYLFLPPGTIAVSTDEEILIDESGGLKRTFGSSAPEPYRVFLRESPPSRKSRGPGPKDLLVSGATQRMQKLAKELAARGRNSEERAFAVEAELGRRCRYSLSVQGVSRSRPLDWFLFEGREGHCEFFAATMVDLLRLEKIPARFVAGYHGGSLEDEASKVTIRASNAHAWVEVWLGPEKGWCVFDPTPPEGIDSLEVLSWWRRLKNSWTRVEDFYDRDILSFGMREQFRLLKLGGEWAGRLKDHIRSLPLWPLVLLLLPAIIFFLLRIRWRPAHRHWGPARRALYRLELRMGKEGQEINSDQSWRQLGLRAASRWPGIAEEILRLTTLAEEEAYAPDHDAERGEIPQISKKIRSKLGRGAL